PRRLKAAKRKRKKWGWWFLLPRRETPGLEKRGFFFWFCTSYLFAPSRQHPSLPIVHRLPAAWLNEPE
ncbi:MAG: hypothetical protein NTZ35_12915, partial [Ignavibacteriales bacterium]|nr:hypothetical protein [Ignavibacteriales bacterium]